VEIPGIWKNVHDGALIGKKQDSSDTDAPSQGALTIPAPKMFCLTGPADHPNGCLLPFFSLYMVEWRRGVSGVFESAMKTERRPNRVKFFDVPCIRPIASMFHLYHLHLTRSFALCQPYQFRNVVVPPSRITFHVPFNDSYNLLVGHFQGTFNDSCEGGSFRRPPLRQALHHDGTIGSLED
jgi:hypothetical protein